MPSGIAAASICHGAKSIGRETNRCWRTCKITSDQQIAASSRKILPLTIAGWVQSISSGEQITATPPRPSSNASPCQRVGRWPNSSQAPSIAHSGVVYASTAARLASVYCIAVSPSAVNAIICKPAILATIGQSALGGSRKEPRTTANANRHSAPLPKRSVASHNGGTDPSASFMAGQLKPQNNTMANSHGADWVERSDGLADVEESVVDMIQTWR